MFNLSSVEQFNKTFMSSSFCHFRDSTSSTKEETRQGQRFMIQFTKETCGDLDAALRREWLETNGLGGFASSTIVGLNTRRYHGLLVAATKPPVGRVVLLSKLEETLFIETPEYNTVDATLWFLEAARAYLAYTGDLDFVRNELYPVFTDIIACHVRGTRYGIKVDPRGLLSSGEEGVQLTWMDARIGDWVVTPRRGKPVEIQALWYNALCIMADLANKFGDEPGQKRY